MSCNSRWEGDAILFTSHSFDLKFFTPLVIKGYSGHPTAPPKDLDSKAAAKKQIATRGEESVNGMRNSWVHKGNPAACRLKLKVPQRKAFSSLTLFPRQAAQMMADAQRKLLPTHLKPICYKIQLESNFHEQSFSGHLEIRSVNTTSSMFRAGSLLTSGVVMLLKRPDPSRYTANASRFLT